MKINIARISTEGLEAVDDINQSVLDLNRDDLRFISPLKVKANLQKTVNVVSADVEISFRLLFACSRCLKEEEEDLTQKYKFNYEIKKEDRFIDLEPDIREEIILAYPVKLLCKPDCQGLCPRCGKDLNQGSCSCEKALLT